MVKILEQKYPKGSIKGQMTDGRYIDGYLYDNLRILAEAIVKDMTFLGIAFSSTLEVGTGKSVFFTQMGEAWSCLMKEIHNIDVPFTCKNIVWRPKDLVTRSFEVPKYSCILVDEWEDAHYWSELGMTLRQFFRKCRQLNLFILIIIPNFFQMPINYAIGRSVFAIDVKFEGKFERGHFKFYNFDAKRDLYILGKKTHNYNVVKPSFFGRFTDGYGVPEDEYRKAKLEDLKNIEIEERQPVQKQVSEARVNAVYQVWKNKDLLLSEGITHKTISLIFNISPRTSEEWIQDARKRELIKNAKPEDFSHA